jgi:hypothetical protein
LQVKLCVEAWEKTPEVSAEELARRLLCHFPSAVLNRERGNAHVQEGLDRLIGMGAPDVILESHRSYFGNVVFATVSEARWQGAAATSYLHRMWPPLGDVVFFDLQGVADEAAVESIARELGTALGMVPCSEGVAKGAGVSRESIPEDSPAERMDAVDRAGILSFRVTYPPNGDASGEEQGQACYPDSR